MIADAECGDQCEHWPPKPHDIDRGLARCSKELPKCSACKPWPGTCDYSRDHPAPKPRTINTQESTSYSASAIQTRAENIDQRLKNVEDSIQALTNTVIKVLEAVNAINPTQNSSAGEKHRNTRDVSTDKIDQGPNLFLGNSHSFSFLKDTSAHINSAGLASTSVQQHAVDELQYLSNSLTTAVLDKEQINNGFHIPSKAEGYKLIGSFLENAGLGDAFFTTPSDELLTQVLFKPETVTRKAWVVYVNYMIVALLSGHETDESAKAEKYRHNMQLALNDSRIFLEPHEINLQALILLAIHGEDYASPNLSWMLVGHACRQAEALGLHAPTHPDYETRQRSLSLFWLLFAVDKSCSLAFGRSCFLPSTIYAQVPLPDSNYLTRFQPHSELGENTQANDKTSLFGAHLFLARMEFAKLTGSLLELLGPGYSLVTQEQLSAQLGVWFSRTNKLLTDTMNSERLSSSPKQLREMSLGISSVKFEYLHILMILHKGVPSKAGVRLEAAREAISLLPSMVSNWASVYNGIIWHLLYFPFIPFFVVFEHLVQNHLFLSTATVEQDLDLLSTTVSYYSSMRDQLSLLATLCARLEHIATAFLRLAQLQVDHRDVLDPQRSSTVTTAQGPFPTTQPPLIQAFSREMQTDNSVGNNAMIDFEQVQAELGDEIGVDLGRYLEWLPADIFPTQAASCQDSQLETDKALPKPKTGNPPGQGSRGTKRPFDVMFDWFAWDVYYAENGS
ncbi:hypothetical protein FSARC_10361 [Fusarium sarcochroum]|uniref:Xylanolytic transcriptional activator regulatory domain-containing protein n=1 Tax=Fusarium sarcochroum TaxID=1208366 RepID=A0A8H4TN38_9HYPO|nr:hypothetical protein FSARC_10361 [Fusarium sarcochroum]